MLRGREPYRDLEVHCSCNATVRWVRALAKAGLLSAVLEQRAGRSPALPQERARPELRPHAPWPEGGQNGVSVLTGARRQPPSSTGRADAATRHGGIGDVRSSGDELSEEVAGVIAFLASIAASCIVGKSIELSSGILTH